MPEQADTDHNIALQGQPLLCLYKSLFKAGTAAEGDHLVFSYHGSFPLSLPLLPEISIKFTESTTENTENAPTYSSVLAPIYDSKKILQVKGCRI